MAKMFELLGTDFKRELNTEFLFGISAINRANEPQTDGLQLAKTSSEFSCSLDDKMNWSTCDFYWSGLAIVD